MPKVLGNVNALENNVRSISVHKFNEIFTKFSKKNMTLYFLSAPLGIFIKLFSSAEMFKKPVANSVDPDQTYRSSLFWVPLLASILLSSVLLGNYLQQTTSADGIFRCIFFLALHLPGPSHIRVIFRSAVLKSAAQNKI